MQIDLFHIGNAFPDLVPPGNKIVYDTLGKLIRDRKVSTSNSIYIHVYMFSTSIQMFTLVVTWEFPALLHSKVGNFPRHFRTLLKDHNRISHARFFFYLNKFSCAYEKRRGHATQFRCDAHERSRLITLDHERSRITKKISNSFEARERRLSLFRNLIVWFYFATFDLARDVLLKYCKNLRNLMRFSNYSFKIKHLDRDSG